MFNNFRLNYLLLFFSIIFSVDINYFSIEYSTSSYWKLMPNIARPFDDKNLFYKSLSSIDYQKNDSLFNSVSFSHALCKNNKQKSIKKLKNF